MTKDNNDCLEYINSFKIRVIKDEVRFWMVRTKKGYFYDEFISNRFIALGWNVITKSTDMGAQSLDALKKEISNVYGDAKPAGSINKCKNFIYDIQEGDYVIIPNKGSTGIAIAKAGEYFEEIEYDVEQEKIVIAKIENREYEISQVRCPYKKRRHIKILNVVDINTLGYGVRRAITSYHGISNFDAYAIDILNGIYDCYSYLGNVYLSINIAKQGKLRPREISKLMYSLTEFFCCLVDEESISTTINLNSPGAIRIKLEEGFEKIKQFKIPLVCMFLAVTGGSAFGVELPGMAGAIKAYRTMDVEIEKEKINLEIQKIDKEAKQEELENKKLENIQKYLELKKQASEQGLNMNEIMKQLEMLQELDTSLEFKTKETEAVRESDS